MQQRPWFCPGVGHGADMFRSGATTAAENAYAANLRGFAGKFREIFRRRFGIDDAVPFALWESGIRHATDPNLAGARDFLQDRQQGLRTQCAIGPDDLDIFVFELHRCGGRVHIAKRGAFFGIGELRDDWQAGKGADGIDCRFTRLCRSVKAFARIHRFGTRPIVDIE